MKVRGKGKTDYLVLTHNKIYAVLAVERGWYRLIDDSGEDYLYPPDNFEIVDERYFCKRMLRIVYKAVRGIFLPTRKMQVPLWETQTKDSVETSGLNFFIF
mgnify:CR=1 FL=1|jgi:hypothetical protein